MDGLIVISVMLSCLVGFCTAWLVGLTYLLVKMRKQVDGTEHHLKTAIETINHNAIQQESLSQHVAEMDLQDLPGPSVIMPYWEEKNPEEYLDMEEEMDG